MEKENNTFKAFTKQIEKPKQETKPVEKVKQESKLQDLQTTLGVYSSDMRESVDRMLSRDALNTDDIKAANPGIRLRYLNKAWRVKEGKMREWQPAEHGKDRPVGDLTLGFMPEDLACERDKRNFERATITALKVEHETQQECAEKIYRDSNGTIRAVINKQDRQKGQKIGTKSYYTVPAQIS